MNNIEYGDKLIKLGRLMKKPNAKLKDLTGLALDCGLIYVFRLIPQKENSVEYELPEVDQ